MNQRSARGEALQQAGVLVLGHLAKGAFDTDLRTAYASQDVERIRTALRCVGGELIRQGRLTASSERRAAERRARRAAGRARQDGGAA